VDGLTARYYGRDFQLFGEPLHTLRKLREHVADWYGAVVDLDVPDDEAREYLNLPWHAEALRRNDVRAVAAATCTYGLRYRVPVSGTSAFLTAIPWR
jgi:hypothetical protein